MKPNIPVILLFAGCMIHAPLRADNTKIVVNSATGESTAIDLTTATRITFSADQSKMTVGTADGAAQSFNIDDISTIVFTIDSAVDTPSTEIGGLTIASEGAIVTIAGAADIEYLAADTSGRVCFSGKGREHVKLDFGPLPAGIYIIRANSSTFKFIKR